MKEFVAKNPKQLDTCLKMLYSEHIKFYLSMRLTQKDKIVYVVSVNVDDETMESLKFKYKVLIG